MTATTLSDISAPPSFAVRGAGYSIAGAVVVLFAFYGTYFVQTLVMLDPEQTALAEAIDHTGGLYTMILSLWQMLVGESLIAARVLSLLAAVMAIVLAFSIARRLTNDLVMAAFLVLSFVLYPPLVAGLVTATPLALSVLAALAVMALWPSGPQALTSIVVGVVAVVGALLHPVALAVMPLWLVMCAVVLGQRQRLLIAAGFWVLAVVLVAFGFPLPVADADVSAAGHGTVLKALALPYAMVIVGTGLSAMAALSSPTRLALGATRTIAVLLGPVAATGVLLVALAMGVLTVGQLVTAAGYTFPLVFLAPWPLIYWVRHRMPQVTSIIAWIAFPVIMYSCFWVVLGPVDPHRFPYSHRHVAQATEPLAVAPLAAP